ncbi:hypothetical protein [Chroococcidiopsis sp.]|uniref:hypothetical protein n=1 Tax=Chroococcidiopsis sp. TaxID=3088168 RepID=UPI003F3C4134
MVTYQEIKTKFCDVMSNGRSFEECIASIAALLNDLPNAENFQIMFDAMHFVWTETHESVDIDELDRMSLKYSRFGEYQEAEIQSQKDSAEEWRKSLEESGVSPEKALGLARLDCELEVATQNRSTAIGSSKSAIAIPQELVNLYRVFYRAEKRHNPERTNALKPLLLAQEIIRSSRSTGEELSQEITGRISARMRQTRSNNAKGRRVIWNQVEEIAAIKRFSDFVVYVLLEQKFNGDKSEFSSKSVSIIFDACFFVYVLEQDKENQLK